MEVARDKTLATDVRRLHLSDGAPTMMTPMFEGTVKKHHVARDISHAFNDASRHLNVGELIKHDAFTLFDSVQALEIMDPKMDSGYLAPGETLYDYFDVTQALEAEQVLGIMDQLLCYEMSWLQGYPLAQNLLTSHHIDNLLEQESSPQRLPQFVNEDGHQPKIEDRPLVQLVLRAYCIATLKYCQLVIDLIWSSMYFEDEDFSTFTFGKDLLTEVTIEDCTELLRTAKSWLLANSGSIDPATQEALLTRLHYRTDALSFVTLSALPAIRWDMVRSSFSAVQSSHSIARPIQEAFSAKIQRKLANTTAPRPIVDMDFDTACKQIAELFDDIEATLEVIDSDAQSSPKNVINFLWVFSSRTPTPSTLARAILQNFLFGERGPLNMNNMSAFLVEDMRDVVADNMLDISHWDVEVPTNSRFIIARQIDFFLEQAAPVWLRVYQALCQNPCRVRRCLTDVLADLAVLQQTLQSKRGLIDNYDFSSEKGNLNFGLLMIEYVAESLRDRVMSWILIRGFGLELYQLQEYPALYCCLDIINHKLAKDTTNILKRHMEILRQGGESPWSVSTAAPLTLEEISHKNETMLLQATSAHITQAMSRTLALTYAMLFSITPALTAREPSLGSLKLQLELRLKPFFTLPGIDVDPPIDMAKVTQAMLGEKIDYLTAIERCTSTLDKVKGCIKQLLDTLNCFSTREPGASTGAVLLADTGPVGESRMRAALGLVIARNEKWWRNEVNSTLRVAVKLSILLSKLLSVVKETGSNEEALRRKVKRVSLPNVPAAEREHQWWIVPEVEWA